MIFNTHYPYIGGGGGKPNFNYTGQYTEIDDGGGNWRIKFLTSGTLTLNNKITVDVFLVGGGGGGSFAPDTDSGGSGGGGGYTNTVKTVSLTPGDYPIVVGDGGAGGTNANLNGSIGGASSAFGFTAQGGENYKSGRAGSGGCGGGYRSSKSSRLNGGNGGSDGSDAPGTGSLNNKPGKGQGTTTREFGESNGDLYAGGGGGGAVYNNGTYTAGKGGAGGGGSGGNEGGTKGADGTPNTGGGGGGSGNHAGSIRNGGGAGGSGIVIIRNAR